VLSQRVGSVMGEANCIRGLAELARMQSDHATANVGFNQALRLYQRIDSILGQANCIKALGDIARVCANWNAAYTNFEQSLSLYRRGEDIRGEAESIIRLGQLQRESCDAVQGLANIKMGFARYFESAPTGDLAIQGWRNIHLAMTSDNETEAQRYMELARSSWATVKRHDLVFDWITTVNM
jgi:hypothetical protein